MTGGAGLDTYHVSKPVLTRIRFLLLIYTEKDLTHVRERRLAVPLLIITTKWGHTTFHYLWRFCFLLFRCQSCPSSVYVVFSVSFVVFVVFWFWAKFTRTRAPVFAQVLGHLWFGHFLRGSSSHSYVLQIARFGAIVICDSNRESQGLGGSFGPAPLRAGSPWKRSLGCHVLFWFRMLVHCALLSGIVFALC